MPTDFLEQLADVPVPPPPPSQAFDRAIHRRINNQLLYGQLFDLVLNGFAYATMHFFRAAIGVLRLTLTGKFETPKNDRNDPAK